MLRSAQPITVAYEGQSAVVLCPSLLGAIYGKARAYSADTSSAARERHLEDAAFLLTLVEDPISVAGRLTRKERSEFRALAARLPPTHSAWRLLGSRASDGISALALLTG